MGGKHTGSGSKSAECERVISGPAPDRTSSLKGPASHELTSLCSSDGSGEGVMIIRREAQRAGVDPDLPSHPPCTVVMSSCSLTSKVGVITAPSEHHR